MAPKNAIMVVVVVVFLLLLLDRIQLQNVDAKNCIRKTTHSTVGRHKRTHKSINANGSINLV